MNFVRGNIYHIYNQGNDRQIIFYKESNYIYFLNKVRKYIAPQCDMLAYVLMPNHFHFLIHANEMIETTVSKGQYSINALSEGIRLLLSSYSKGINKQEEKTGNLIRQKTKHKCVCDINNENSVNYAEVCFDHIHQNPIRSGLTDRIEDWHYSSYRDYAGLRTGSLCNQELAKKLMNIDLASNYSLKHWDSESLKNIW